jgi:hypothetical protein
MSKKYSVTFRLETSEEWESLDRFEAELHDIIKTVVAPSFHFEILPLTFTVKKARN